MVRRPALHSVLEGSIPLVGSFVFFSSFDAFFLVFQKKASASVVEKPPIPTNCDSYLQNRHDSGYILLLYLIHLALPGGRIHRIQKIVFYLMNLQKTNSQIKTAKVRFNFGVVTIFKVSLYAVLIGDHQNDKLNEKSILLTPYTIFHSKFLETQIVF